MPAFREFPRPEGARSQRVELAPATLVVLQELARANGLSVAVLCRFALDMLAQGGSVALADVPAVAEKARVRLTRKRRGGKKAGE